MQRSISSRYQKADVLAKSIENVFRRLIRILLGKITLVKLQDILREIYVQEAEQYLRQKTPGKNVPLTKLALMTGLDTRTLAIVRKNIEASDFKDRERFLSELTPESAVLEAWSERAAKNTSMTVMGYGHEQAEFDKLVRSTISGRGVTSQSVIERLEATGSIEHDRQNKEVRLLVQHFSPYLSKSVPDILIAGFSAVGNLLSTISHNLDQDNEEHLFQRQVWSFRVKPEDVAALRKEARRELEGHEKSSKLLLKKWEQKNYGDELRTAGVGFYYFEENR